MTPNTVRAALIYKVQVRTLGTKQKETRRAAGRDATLEAGAAACGANNSFYREIIMKVIWNFDGGLLTARNGAGRVLRQWVADDALGRGLVALLNQAQSLSRLLVQPAVE